MNKNYSPILTTSTKKTFMDYIECINLPEIDYIAIGIQSKVNKKSISLMSLEDWQKHFSINQYAEFDPLRKATLNTNRYFLPFNELDYSDNFGKEIMRQRAAYGINNGIVLMERLNQYNYIITLGTGFSRFEPYEFLKQNYYSLKYLKHDLIKIIDKDAKDFLSQEFIKPIY